MVFQVIFKAILGVGGTRGLKSSIKGPREVVASAWRLAVKKKIFKHAGFLPQKKSLRCPNFVIIFIVLLYP
jgi:hypothetical protein